MWYENRSKSIPHDGSRSLSLSEGGVECGGGVGGGERRCCITKWCVDLSSEMCCVFLSVFVLVCVRMCVCVIV